MSLPRTGATEQFADRAGRHGINVYRCASQAEVPGTVASIVQSVGGKIAIVAPDLGDIGGDVAAALEAGGIQVLLDGDARTLATADTGVAQARMGVAETGSLVVAGNDLVGRLATMLPLVHVAILHASLVASSLDEVTPLLRSVTGGNDGGRPVYVSIVTGASRTADIEKVLTVGVQGPREVHVIMVGEPEPGGQVADGR